MNVYLVYLEWSEKCFRADEAAVRFLRATAPKGIRVVWVHDEAAFLKALPRATHALVWYFKEEWFPIATSLKVLATPAAGRELVPTVAPTGVRVHFGHFHGEAMAESAAAFALGWARGFFLKGNGVWPRAWMSDKVYEVAGTKAVIVGYGNVGKAVGRKFEALGIEVLGYSRHAGITPARLDRALAAADWLVLALPGDTGTDRWLDAKRIAKLPRRCVVLNVGRGSSVDETALFRALGARRIAGAYLDVRTTEPYRRFALPGGTAGLPPTPTLDNLVLMPHAAAFTPDYIKRFIGELRDDGCL